MDRPALRRCRDLGPLVHRLAEDVQDATERRGADGDGDRAPGVVDGHPTHDGVGGAHRDGTDLIAPDVLLHLGDDADGLPALGGGRDLERVVELGKVTGGELDVEDGSDDLDDLADGGGGGGSHVGQPWSAEAPPTISAISCVICAWRARL